MEDFGTGTDLSRMSSFERALASSPFSEPSKEVSVFSEFGDSDCGEPLEPHHILLNFTPTDEDDDFTQRKCCEFWKYIHSRKDLQGMMVRPEAPPSSPDTDVDSIKPFTSQRRPKPLTAVSMLQIVEKKGLIDRAFEVKLQQSRCSLGSHEYVMGAQEQKTKCPCPAPCLMKCPNMPISYAQAVCDQLRTWDIDHPKSMEPPCHPPSSVGTLMDQSFGAKSQQSQSSLGLDDYINRAKAENMECYCNVPSCLTCPSTSALK